MVTLKSRSVRERKRWETLPAEMKAKVKVDDVMSDYLDLMTRYEAEREALLNVISELAEALSKASERKEEVTDGNV